MMVMRLIFAAALFLLMAAPGATQDDDFEISSKVSVRNVLPGQDFSVAFVFDIPENHYLYKDDIALDFEGVDVAGTFISKPKTKYDPFFEKDLLLYATSCTVLADLTAPQETGDGPFKFSALVRYRGCTDEVCFFPEEKAFQFELAVADKGDRISPINREVFSKREGLIAFVGEIPIKGQTGKPQEFLRAQTGQKEPEEGSAIHEKTDRLLQGIRIRSERTTLEQVIEEWGWVAAFFIVFVGGIGISLTPCIYPLIPITLAVIGAKKESAGARKGLLLSMIYVLGISITYGILGMLAASVGSAVSDVLNSPIAKGVIGAVFVALALSMFGLYEIQMPPSLQTKLRARKWGSLGGVFLMGLVTGCIATPCIAPALAATLLFVFQSHNILMGFWLCFTFAWGMGLLLVAVGTVAGLQKSLPGASGWMVTVKKVFGFLLLAAALFFMQSILPAPIFRFLFGLLLFIFGIFAGAFDRLKEEESFLKKLAKGAGVLLLIGGAVYILAAFFVPPDQPIRLAATQEYAPTSAGRIDWTEDPQAAFSTFRQGKKPMLIEFWQEECAVCEAMEKSVLSRAAIVNESKRFIALKLDFTRSSAALREIKETFGVFGTPAYVFLNTDGSAVVKVRGMEANEFLETMRRTH
jgi:thiol:disulfide interchange protein DsbD